MTLRDLFPLFFVFLLGISEIKIAGVVAASVGESVDRQAGILILWFLLINWSLLSWLLYYYLTSKGLKISPLQMHRIVGYSAVPFIIYNFYVTYLEEELAGVYIPIDPFGIAYPIFLKGYSLEFMSLHLLVWASALAVFAFTLRRTLPQIKNRELFTSALLAGVVGEFLLMFEYLALTVYSILILFGISAAVIFIYKIKRIKTEVRSRILRCLEEKGALHFSGLARVLNLKKSTLSYHLNVLERFGLVRSAKAGRFKVYYTDSFNDKYLNGTAKEILKYLAMVQESTAGDIARAIGLSPSTVSYHLKKLEDAGLVLIDKSGREARVRALAKADSPGYSS
ncbi:winged helix-turn-helix transcriptional regulator [Candidatus Pyrohabitans sp.]